MCLPALADDAAQGVALKVEGLLARMAPTCRGSLRRRTRFTRSWRTDADTFEIRSTMLVLYKRRSGTSAAPTGSSIGFLDAIFSRATMADLDNNNATSSFSGPSGATAEAEAEAANAGNWNCVFDLTGATAVAQPHDEKAHVFPFKITFGAGGGDAERGALNLCAETEPQR
jgi:hypothetical protein